MATEAQIKIVIDSTQATKSIDTLQAELKQVNKELDKAIKIYGENSKQADNYRKNIAGLEVEMGKLKNASNLALGSQQSLKAELRQITNELAGLEPGSARFVELSQRAGKLRDTIQDTNNVINATAGTGVERFGKAIGAATQIGVSGFQGLLGVQALFGVENENLQKQMVKLTGVLNLSQAITSLGGIGDAFTEIKSGIMPVITGMYSFITAEVAATGASGALATAMNAIPFVALATAIGLAVYGIYSYVSANNEAAKKEKERAASLEQQRKTQEELEQQRKSVIDGVVNENAELGVLLLTLRQTNKGSKERKAVMKELNDTYPGLITNLKDESKFQEQVNGKIQDYIAYTRLRVLEEVNEGKIKKAIAKQQEAIDRVQSLAANGRISQYTAEQYELALLGKKKVGDIDFSKDMWIIGGKLNDTQKQTVKILDESQQSLSTYNGIIEDASRREVELKGDLEEVRNSLNLNTESTNTNKDSVKDNTDETEKYAEVLRLAQYELDRLSLFQETQAKLETDRITSSLEQDKKSIETKYGDERKNLIEKSLEEQLRLEEEKFKKEGKTTEEWKTREAAIRKQADDEILANRVGIFSENELKVFQLIEQYRQQDIDNLITSYNTKEQITLSQTEQILANTRLIELQHQKKVELEDIDNLTITEEEKNKKKLEIRQKYADAEIQLIKDEAAKQKNILDLQLQQTLADTSLTNSEKQQAQAKYSEDTIKLAQDTADKINDINEGIKSTVPSTEDEIASAVEKAEKYLDKVAELWGQLSSTITSYQQEQNKQREALLEEAFNNEKTILDEQLKNKIITEEQYQYELDRIESDRQKKETDLKKKAFEQQKKLQIVNATIQGAQAILNAYSSGLATPLIGPATGAVYAAIAAAFAAAQIQQISSQQFTAAQGGIVPGNGSGNIDSVPSMLAPGEFVINSNSASMFPNLLSNINEAGGGKKLVPDLPPVSNSQTTPNIFVNQQSNQPIKAYVVETDISESQRRINRIKQSVEF